MYSCNFRKIVIIDTITNLRARSPIALLSTWRWGTECQLTNGLGWVLCGKRDSMRPFSTLLCDASDLWFKRNRGDSFINCEYGSVRSRTYGRDGLLPTSIGQHSGWWRLRTSQARTAHDVAHHRDSRSRRRGRPRPRHARRRARAPRSTPQLHSTLPRPHYALWPRHRVHAVHAFQWGLLN